MISNKDHVSLRGTRNGILVSISESCPLAEGLEQLKLTLHQRRAFFAGQPLSLDLGWREVSEEEADLVIASLKETGVRLLGIISTSQITRHIFEARGLKVIIGTLGLARHGARARQGTKPAAEPPRAAAPPANIPQGPPPASAEPSPAPPATPPQDVVPAPGVPPPPTPAAPTAPSPASASAPAPAPSAGAAPSTPGADTMLLRRNLRSGQRVQFPGNIVVMGDVNAGAEVQAEGDVIVLGTLRGTAHAGAGPNGRKDAVVVALNLHATQVRIGDLIGFVQTHKGFQQNAAVMARIQDGSVATCLYGS